MNRRGRYFLLFPLPLTLAVAGAVLAQQYAAAPASVSALPTATPTRTPTRTLTPKQKTDRPAQGAQPGVASQAVGTSMAIPTATATPLPVPKKPPAAGAAASAPLGAGTSVKQILNTPYHALDRLDFDEVWDGQSALKTFSLTTTAAGYLRAEIPPGPFFVTEIRELGPPKAGGSKNSLGPPQPVISQETKGKVTFPEGQPGPWTYGAVGAGDQILIHVVFKPKFQLGSMRAGQKAATMKVSGPGPKGTWNLSVPMQGMFNGKAVFEVGEPAPIAVFDSPSSHDLAVWVSGVGVSVKGTIRGGSLPAGMSVNPLAVVVPGNQLLRTTVPLKFVWGTGGMSSDNQPRTAELLFDYPGGTEKLSFAVVGLPSTISVATNGFQQCHATWLFARVNLNAKGTASIKLFLKNDNIVNYNIEPSLGSVGGVKMRSGPATTNFVVAPFKQNEVDYSTTFDPAEWRQIVQNPSLSFDCNASSTGSTADPPKIVLN